MVTKNVIIIMTPHPLPVCKRKNTGESVGENKVMLR